MLCSLHTHYPVGIALSTAAPTDYPPHLDGILEKAVSSQVEEEHSPNTVHFVEDKV